MSSSSSNSIKTKKSSKDGERSKSQSSSTDSSSNEKGSPEKEYNQYAGISSDIIRNYAEQSMFESYLTEEVCNTVSEDINYKLRYIIHDALLKARLSGRNAISAGDIQDTFSHLSIDRVYGAQTNPNWVPFSDLPGTGSSDQTFFYLDDNLVNLIGLAEEEITEVQYGDVTLTNKWYPEPDKNNDVLKDYFSTACQSLISGDEELRKLALKDISENPHVGPITQWFYHFGYFLLKKDVTFDSLTLRGLDLVETLENSPLGSASVSAKQLKLLIRLLLQRLLLTSNSPDVLNRMCFTLSILCLRKSLMEITITKINEKLDAVHSSAILPVLTIIYFLGIDAVKEIFLPHLLFFLDRVAYENNTEMTYITLAIYGLICKAEYNETYVHNWFDTLIPNELVIYWKPLNDEVKEMEKEDINFVAVKSKLIKIRRKVDCTISSTYRPTLEKMFQLPFHECKKRKIDEFREGVKINKKQTHITVGKTSLLLSPVLFELPCHRCTVKRKMDELREGVKINKKQTHITVGKTSLLLSVLNSSKKYSSICSDHSLLSYNL